MVVMNVPRILGDVSHTLSKCILIWAIHWNRSAEGVSLITQALYILVFVTRYLDLFWVPPWDSYWNFILKNFYIWSSVYIIAVMMRLYPRTREREKAWKLGAMSLGGAVILAPLVTVYYKGKHISLSRTLWSFSIILESVCVLPQLLLLRQTTVPTVIDSFYLLTLGSYRAFYIVNWIVRALDPDDQPHDAHPIAVIFGVVQTALYLDFAWVYWTRQRVKLRGGGIVDSDDLKKGWLLRGILGRRSTSADEDEDGVVDTDPLTGDGIPRVHPGGGGRWGARGISVSADDGVLETPSSKRAPSDNQQDDDEDGLAAMLEDDLDDDHVIATDGDLRQEANRAQGGEEWRDNDVRK